MDQTKKEMLAKRNIFVFGSEEDENVIEVKVSKISPFKYKELIRTLDGLPGLLFETVMRYFSAEDRKSFFQFLVISSEFAMDDLVEITSILSGIDKDKLMNEYGLDEQVEYLELMYQRNNLEKVLKKVMSPLQKILNKKQNAEV
jgi:hypothetical protein